MKQFVDERLPGRAALLEPAIAFLFVGFEYLFGDAVDVGEVRRGELLGDGGEQVRIADHGAEDRQGSLQDGVLGEPVGANERSNRDALLGEPAGVLDGCGWRLRPADVDAVLQHGHRGVDVALDARGQHGEQAVVAA